jgi:hypothetical protein
MVLTLAPLQSNTFGMEGGLQVTKHFYNFLNKKNLIISLAYQLSFVAYLDGLVAVAFDVGLT